MFSFLEIFFPPIFSISPPALQGTQSDLAHASSVNIQIHNEVISQQRDKLTII